MKTRSPTSWPRRPAARVFRANGLTLVEVLAGTALLGSLLVGILLAKHRLTVQSRLAETRLAAYEALDGLLTEWWTSPEGVPREAAGEAGRWRWRTRREDAAEAEALDATIVVVELFEADVTGRAPAASVELLLPVMDTEP